MSAARLLMTYFPSGPGIGMVKTIAIGSFGLMPGPSVRRDIWPSFSGVSHDVSAKRLACQRASKGFLSALEMHCLMEVGLWGGTIESTRIRPRDDSGSIATFDGIA